MEQLTWGLIIALFLLTLGSSVVLKRRNAPSVSPNIHHAQEQGILPDELKNTPEDTKSPSAE